MNETFTYGQHGNKIITIRRDYPLHEETTAKAFVAFAKEMARKGIVDLVEINDELCQAITETVEKSAEKTAKKIKGEK